MNEQAYKSIITKCWADPAFKQQFIADPVGILRSEGVAVPDGIKINLVEDTASQITFVIPPEPSELSEEVLEEVAGGFRNAFGSIIVPAFA
jgi:hypothetical protein